MSAPGVAVRAGPLEARNGQAAAGAARAQNNFVRLQPQPALGLNRVRVNKVGGSRFFMNRYAHALNLLTPD